MFYGELLRIRREEPVLSVSVVSVKYPKLDELTRMSPENTSLLDEWWRSLSKSGLDRDKLLGMVQFQVASAVREALSKIENVIFNEGYQFAKNVDNRTEEADIDDVARSRIYG